jgi:hypothetical protein
LGCDCDSSGAAVRGRGGGDAVVGREGIGGRGMFVVLALAEALFV